MNSLPYDYWDSQSKLLIERTLRSLAQNIEQTEVYLAHHKCDETELRERAVESEENYRKRTEMLAQSHFVKCAFCSSRATREIYEMVTLHSMKLNPDGSADYSTADEMAEYEPMEQTSWFCCDMHNPWEE